LVGFCQQADWFHAVVAGWDGVFPRGGQKSSLIVFPVPGTAPLGVSVGPAPGRPRIKFMAVEAMLGVLGE
jgi:hypothetical protein